MIDVKNAWLDTKALIREDWKKDMGCGCGGGKPLTAVQRINAIGPISPGPAAPIANTLVRPMSNVNPKVSSPAAAVPIETEQDRKRIARLRQEAIRAALHK